MISYLSGKIIDIDDRSFTVLTFSGVGYKVYVPINTLLSKNIEDTVEVQVHTVVKDDAIDLYGFTSKEELEMFEKLITVSGVGPRSAITALSVSSVTNIAIAVENGDASILSHIPGLGKKTCEKIIIELKGKLGKFIKNSDSVSTNTMLEENDARLALTSLGYNEKDINLAINKIKENKSHDFVEFKAGEIIKETLKYLR